MFVFTAHGLAALVVSPLSFSQWDEITNIIMSSPRCHITKNLHVHEKLDVMTASISHRWIGHRLDGSIRSLCQPVCTTQQMSRTLLRMRGVVVLPSFKAINGIRTSCCSHVVRVMLGVMLSHLWLQQSGIFNTIMVIAVNYVDQPASVLASNVPNGKALVLVLSLQVETRCRNCGFHFNEFEPVENGVIPDILLFL